MYEKQDEILDFNKLVNNVFIILMGNYLSNTSIEFEIITNKQNV